MLSNCPLQLTKRHRQSLAMNATSADLAHILKCGWDGLPIQIGLFCRLAARSLGQMLLFRIYYVLVRVRLRGVGV